jgi:hypothetical protein
MAYGVDKWDVHLMPFEVPLARVWASGNGLEPEIVTFKKKKETVQEAVINLFSSELTNVKPFSWHDGVLRSVTEALNGSDLKTLRLGLVGELQT